MPVENIKLLKINLRAYYRQLRTNMDRNYKAYLDEQILSMLTSLGEYKKQNVIFTYVSKDIEVNTINIIQKALKDGKKVAVPKCITENRAMEFYYIDSLDDLETGTFGVLEPIVSKCVKVTDLSNGICIVPGFCFDSLGYRLGYGKGYYDRFLPRFHGTTVGLCYSCCITKELPHGYFDKPVNLLITDKYMRRTLYNKKRNVWRNRNER